MRVAAETCRKQEAIQRKIAMTDALENRRNIALAAANAWGKEAAEADKREARELKRRIEVNEAGLSSANLNQTDDDSSSVDASVDIEPV